MLVCTYIDDNDDVDENDDGSEVELE